MTVNALLNRLYDELKEHQERADRCTSIRDYHYEYGMYSAGLKYDLMRVQSINEMDVIIKTITEIEKRVS